MAVIRCQACGKPNPDILDECQYCGARLKPLVASEPADQTLVGAKASVIRCPACGRPNPSSLDVCQYCQARLKPLLAGGAEGAAPPAAAAAPPAAEDALARLRASAQPPAAEPEGEPEEPEPEPSPAEWMSRLRGFGAAASAPADETLAAPGPGAASQAEPDWLWTGTPSAEPPPAQEEITEPSWLRPEPPPPAAVPDSNETLPDWMIDSEAPPAVPPSPREREVPSWLRPEPEEKPARPKLTDWLERSAAPPAAEPEEQAPEAEEPSTAPGAADETLVPTSRPRKKMTDWLLSTGTLASKSVEAQEPQADMPDWLKAMQPADEVPDWLQAAPGPTPTTELQEKPPAETPSAAEQPARRGAGEPAPAEPTEALPDWLQALRDEQMGAAEVEALSARQRQQTTPEWIQSAAPGEPAPPTPPAEAVPEPAAAEPESGEPAAAAPVQPDETLIAASPEGAAAEAEGELPEWLQPAATAVETEPAAEAPEPPAPLVSPEDVARAAEELPEWLRNLAPSAEAAEAVPGQELPDWLKPVAAQAVPSAAAAPTVPPEWARGDTGALPRPPETAAPVPVEPAAPVVDVPEIDAETKAWLSSMATQPLADEATAAAIAGAPAPEWLSALAAATAASAPAAGAAGQAAPAAPPAAEADEEIPAAVPTPVEEMPDWLRALRGLRPAEAPQPAEEMPDWLRTLRGLPAVAPTTEPAEAAAPAAEAAAAAEAAEPSGLPSWLSAMVSSQPVEAAAVEADEYEENIGVLAGMRGVLRAEPVIAQPHKSTTPVHRLEVAETHAAQAALLTTLLQEEATPQPAPRRAVRAAAVAVAVERWVVFAVFALAILVAQFVLPGVFPAPSTIRPETKAAFNVIEQVPAGRPALVAFDYDPAQQGELGPGAVAIVTHLLRRGVPVVAVSARPMGAAVAQAVLTQVATDLSAQMSFSYTYGTHYLNLGYVPGGPVGMQEFAAAPRALIANDFTGVYPDSEVWNTSVLAGVTRLADFGLVVLVSATPDGARAWIEQTQIYAADVNRLAVVSAGAEPMVQPYLQGQTPQLHGLVSGLAGAAQYELQAEVPGEANARWSALGGGLLMAALLIGAGNVIFALMGVARRRR